MDVGMSLRNRVCITPVGRGFPAIEQAGCGENRHAGAQRHQARTSGMGRLQRPRSTRLDWLVDPAPAGHDDQVCLCQKFEPA